MSTERNEPMGNSPEVDQRSIELTDTLWREFEYRHKHYWRLLVRVTLAITAILVFPISYSAAVKQPLDFAIFFPILSFVLSTAGPWLIMSEGIRIQWSLVPYLALRDRRISDAGLPSFQEKVSPVFSARISKITAFLLALFGQSLSAAYFLIILKVPSIALVAMLIPIAAACAAVDLAALYRATYRDSNGQA